MHLTKWLLFCPQLMKDVSITLLILLSTVTFLKADPAPPQPGYYVGLLRVTKVHHQPDGLSSSYTLRAQARVFDDGTISFATSAPESPAAASNVESTLNRAAPIVPPPVNLYQPLILLASTNPVTVVKTSANYLVDSKYRAELTTDRNVLKLSYANPVAGYEITEVVIPGGERTRLAANTQFTMFQYTLRKQR
jgi:hypothetical protein